MQLLDTPSTSDLLEAATTCSSWNLLEELVGLQSLEISSSDDLAELPLSMRKLTSLQQLKIWNSVSLQALPGWIGELSSLGRFDIRGCTRLSSLPLFSRTCVACISLSREKESYNTFKAGNPWITPELQRTTPKHKQKLHITKQRACTRGETSVSQGEDIPQRPVTGCHPKERLLKDALKKSHRLSRRSVEGPRISLFPEGLEQPMSMVQLNSLRHLIIGNCDALQLPEWMGDLGSLQSLDIWASQLLQTLKLSFFDALLVLPKWLGELSALRQLKIETCPSLTSLPSSMKCLTSLQELEIIRCPNLNFGIITLIPKVSNAIKIQQYRPICVLNVSFKISLKWVQIGLIW
ncbi:hypothetical protein SORBI_3006G014632 [Sorghum bicolor]|uniref:Uncharacterized protein n=1 Tax=Sorghum bicolor TaxID=4558 RepID=A0A1Z5RBL8_SORBI|nr:hypothetical protein SORBI_3006G014632 [Sorghum bicolor]